MKLNDLATIRTGLVMSRKKAQSNEFEFSYPALSLKNVTEEGSIIKDEIEKFSSVEKLKAEYFTRKSDILLKLSAPYSVVLIKDETGLLIPSHFAIIRTNNEVEPSYLHWWLCKNRNLFYQMASGGTIMGTISVGYVSEISIVLPPHKKKKALSDLIELSAREQALLTALAEKKQRLTDAIVKKHLREK